MPGKTDRTEERKQPDTGAPLPRRMLPTDALFWYAEEVSPGMRSTIAGLFFLPLKPDFDHVREAVAQAMHTTPRLRQKAVEAPFHLLAPEWVEDPHMDLEYHVRREAVAPPGHEAALLTHVAALLASPLDRARPLWELHVLEGTVPWGAAVLIKAHHSMVDGVGALALLEAFTEAVPEVKPKRPVSHAKVLGTRPSPHAALLRDLIGGAVSLARGGLALAGSTVTHPFVTAQRAAATARGAAGMIRDLQAEPIRDPLASEATGLSRRLDRWSVPMAELQRARKALDVPINDIMLASVAGAVGRYYALRGARMTGLRAMVPMSLRTDSEKHALGNRVGMLNIELPVGEVDPERRLKIIHRRTHQAKRDGRGAIYPFLTPALGLLPGFALKTFVQGSMERVNLVCTNIPGIKQPRWFAGRMIERIIPYAPVVEGCPLSIALFSYRNDLEIGIATDPEAIPDPEKIRAHLADAYAEIITLASTREHAPRPSPRRRRRGKKH